MKKDFVDFYKILSVDPKAKPEAIKQAWRKKMMQFHPDLHADEQDRYEEISRQINRAYSVLSNAKSRAEFDDFRRRTLAEPGATGIPVLAFGEKTALTVLTVCLTLFFFALPPWANCGNALLRYLFSGQNPESVNNPFLSPTVLILSAVAGMLVAGKYLRERFMPLVFLAVFSLAVAGLEVLVIPLRGHTEIIIPVLLGAGIFCVFQSYAEQKNLILGTLLRVLALVACVVTYRAGGLIYRAADALVSAGCLLLCAAFLIACLCSAFSDNAE